MEKLQKKLEKSWPKYPNEADRARMRDAYSNLRATIELVIEGHVFAGVIQRYRDWVQVNNLDKAVGFDKSEYEELARLHGVCCDITGAHDHASAKDSAVRDPTDLGKDIGDLRKLTECISLRRNTPA